MNQRAQILSALKEGRHLTPHDARKLCGSDRLAARIAELREAGHKINTARVETPSGAFVASYSMEKQAWVE